MYKYILYPWRKDVMLAILCTDIPIITTLAGEQLNSLILHGDIKCITANGYTITYVEANYTCMSHDNYLFHTLGSAE